MKKINNLENANFLRQTLQNKQKILSSILKTLKETDKNLKVKSHYKRLNDYNCTNNPKLQVIKIQTESTENFKAIQLFQDSQKAIHNKVKRSEA